MAEEKTSSSSASEEEMSFVIKDCQVLGVTVYKDRAEVVRTLKLPATETRNYKVVINDLTLSCDAESIRFKGTPNCQILEVGHEVVTKAVARVAGDDKDTKSTTQALKDKLKDLQRRSKELDAERTQNVERKKLTQSYSNGVLSEAKVIDLEKAKEILSFYSTEVAAIDKVLLSLEEEQTVVVAEINVTKKQLAQLGNIDQTDMVTSLCLTVLMDVCSAPQALADGGASATTTTATNEVQFSYVVFGASWCPSYDLRVLTADNSMSLSYFAEVTQQSGEDWNDCSLCLSTSNPAVGSSPDKLPIKTVDWEWKVNQYKYGAPPKKSQMIKKSKGNGSTGGGMRGGFTKELNRSRGRNSYEGEEDDDDMCESVDMMADHFEARSAPMMASSMDEGVAPPPPHIPSTGVEGSGDAGSTNFTILRQVSIAADNKPHKVVVATLSLSPQMIYYVAPSVSTSVYLQSKTLNTSSYPLLSSSKVSVFLDGNFISTSSLKQANSGEFFNTFLGVDPSFKVEYPPCLINSKVTGWISGTNVKKYQYSTFLVNTKQYPCKVMVVECLPRSQNEKIVVDLIEPKESQLAKNKNVNSATNEQDFIGTLEAMSAADASVVDSSVHGSGGAVGSGASSSSSSTSFRKSAGGSGADAATTSKAIASPSSSEQQQVWPSDFIMHNVHTSSIIWLKTVQPGERTELKFEYKISSPEKQSVVIMNN